MALYYTSGDPDYLKVVLLRNTLAIPSSVFVSREGLPTGTKTTELLESHSIILILPDGNWIFSANEVCRYLCFETGHEKFAAVGSSFTVDYWLEWEASKLKSAVSASLLSGSASPELLVCLGRLESHLSTTGGQYIIPEALSLADVVVWASLYVLLAPEGILSRGIHKDYPLVTRWFISLAQQDSFSSATWAASKDVGFEAYSNFVLGKRLPVTGVAAPKQSKPIDSKKNIEERSQHKGSNPESVAEVIPSVELQAAKESWLKNVSDLPRPIKREHPILPSADERNILITSALPYVNNVPHLGNIIGCVLSADVFARYCRLRNYNTLYICGTDEYGTATETKALEEGVTPQEICSKYFAIHSAVYEWFNIEFDYFGRTNTPQQTQIAQDIFWRLNERGFILKDKVEQLQCQHCSRFLADRFVEGTCPFCSYEDARGDQCDKCGKLINAIELKSPRCKVCSGVPQVRTSNHLFLDLPKLEETVHKWFQGSSDNGCWSNNAQFITATWLRDGLKPRCISRDLKWGTPIPLEGYTEKVFYVWFDAPIGYLSITACYTEQWEKWWKNPDQVQLYQFMAKDNIPFHTMIFPCSLLGADDNYTLLNHISSAEYLNYESGKFSKSRGVGVFGTDAKDTGIPADIYRFYLLYVRPETQDSSFSWSDFVWKNNSELLGNLGNFINRVLMFLKNSFDSTLSEVALTEEDVQLLAKVTRELNGYINCLEKIRIRDGLKHILAISRLGNGHMQSSKPWLMIKGTPQQIAHCGSLLTMYTNIVCLLSVMLQPYMPQVSKTIQEQLQAPPDCNVLLEEFIPFLKAGHRIGHPTPLFSKIEESAAQTLKKTFAGKSSATAATAQITALREQLDKQAALVRQLKAGDASKEQIAPEIQRLLEIKKQLGISK